MSYEEWFGPHVPPTAALKEYMTARPRGMTNGPQNPKVMQALISELEEYGVQLEAPVWPMPNPLAETGSLEDDNGWRNPGPRKASSLTRSHSSWLRHGTCHELENKLSDAMVPYSPQDMSHSRGSSRPASRPASGNRRTIVSASGHIIEGKQVMFSAAKWKLMKQTEKQEKLKETREAKRSASAPRLQTPQPRKTGYLIRLPSPVPRQHQGSAKDTSGSKDQAAAGEGGEEEKRFTLKAKPVMSEHEIVNSLVSLRAQGRLHHAFVGDTFRFGSDLSSCASMVLAGAPGPWGSNAADLNKLHNKAVRQVDPSGLTLLPKETKKKKKKKGDEDDLTTGSGKFPSLYEADPAYRTLRGLRRAAYPGDEEAMRQSHYRDTVNAFSSGLLGSGSKGLLVQV